MEKEGSLYNDEMKANCDHLAAEKAKSFTTGYQSGIGQSIENDLCRQALQEFQAETLRLERLKVITLMVIGIILIAGIVIA